MNAIVNSITRRGGMATTAQLLADRHDIEHVRIHARYGVITRVSKGWWATNEVSTDALRARRAGGRLACVNALAHHGVVVPQEWLDECHVSIERSTFRHVNASRIEQSTVFHWSRHRPPGDVLSVDTTTAYRQLGLCRSLAARAGLSRAAWRAIALDRVYDR